ncbi:uncharacterized protein PV07_04250 [Cladophialophora immunda]|uniref:DUF7708 domain-containing protein n=1 Tax=Cladophialophora immunda TaxID=569365 RepID=A0A0D2B556_9EURO|nr:uncharacterized protein PV07_04250 [Cladophialophora immunda]KIW32722.1 hypothetical protein PV07_04250 [Cladophialophora immunda]OQU95286.1 hypothetical protein CLAIMM_01517 [Cladophialophora immunda]
MTTSLTPQDVQLDGKGSSNQATGNIVEQAFQEAVQYFCNELTQDEVEQRWIAQRTSIGDVLAVVKEAETKYLTSKSNHGNFRRFLAHLPERLLHYSGVIDVFVQAHPEYSALAWGAVKFVLLGVIEHAKLFSEISEALILIGDALAQADFNSKLYPISSISAAVSRLYVYIILFLQKAVKWYTMGRARRWVNAVFEPYDIGYKSTVEKIQKCIASLKDTANSAAHAELRGITKSQEHHQEKLELVDEEVRGVRQELRMIGIKMASQEEALNKVLHYVSGSQAISNRLLLYAEDGKVAAILDELESGFDAMGRYHACLAVSQKRKAWTHAGKESALALAAIRRWASSARSAFLVVQGSPREEAKIKDLVVDVVHWAREIGAPTIWTLSDRVNGPDRLLSSLAGVWKTLASQIIRQDSSILSKTSANLTISELKTQHAATDWKALFSAAVTQIQKCVIVVEARALFDVMANNPSEVAAFLLEFQTVVEAANSRGSTVKILVASYCASRTAITSLPAHDDRSTIFVRRSMSSRHQSRPTTSVRKRGLRHIRGF